MSNCVSRYVDYLSHDIKCRSIKRRPCKSSISKSSEYARNATLLLVVTKLFLAPAAASADFASALLSLDSAPQTDILVHHKLPHDIHPALVYRQLVIEFVRNAVQLGEAGPWNSGKVVVLVVQTDVVCEVVEDAVVRVCLWDRNLVRGV